METLFENQYKRTPESYREFYSYLYFKSPMAIVFHVCIVLVILLTLLFVLFPGSAPSDFSRNEWGVILFLLLFFFVLNLFRYRRAQKISYQRDLELNNGEQVEIVLTVTDSGIGFRRINSENITHVDFAKIKKIFYTKNFIHVMTQTKTVYSFKKDGFTKGTPQEFLSFMKSKGFKVKA